MGEFFCRASSWLGLGRPQQDAQNGSIFVPGPELAGGQPPPMGSEVGVCEPSRGATCQRSVKRRCESQHA